MSSYETVSRQDLIKRSGGAPLHKMAKRVDQRTGVSKRNFLGSNRRELRIFLLLVNNTGSIGPGMDRTVEIQCRTRVWRCDRKRVMEYK